MIDKTGKDQATVHAVDRALAILGCFKNDDDGLSVSEIARRTGLYKSTALRLVNTLCAWHYLQKGDDGLYRIGPAPFYIGQMYRRHFKLEELANRLLKRLADTTGETASIYVRHGDERICLFRIESSRSVRHNVSVGQRLPLNAGAAGRALLAFCGEQGPEFDAIRAQGYAISIGERDPLASAIAAPIWRGDNSLVGVVSVSGPKERFRPHEDPTIPALVKEIAREFSQALGHVPSRPR